jgi:hypothetical protein
MDDNVLTDDVVENSHSTRPPVFASWQPIVLLVLLLPAFVAVSTHWMLVAIQNQRLKSIWLYPWMTFVTALLSWCVGRYLNPAWLRWLVFVWCLALLDIVTIAACLGGSVPDQIGYVLVSAQLTFITAWAILGPWGWQWRLPMMLVTVAAVVVQSGSFTNQWNAESWDALMVLTAIVVALLCIGLRLCKFRLRKTESAISSSLETDALQVNQFGMKHMLIWATAVVPILLVARGLEGVFVGAIIQSGLFVALLLAVCVATINLLAIWAVLGSGLMVVRLTLLFIVPLAMAMGLTFCSTVLQRQYGRWNGPALINLMIEMEDYWFAWFGLAAALSAALLLFARAGGYRLGRVKA